MARMSDATARSARARQIGPWGTAARGVVGVGLLALAVVSRPTPLEVLLGLVAAPTVVVVLLAARGLDAPELRLHQPWAHAANIAVAVVFISIAPTVAFLFYGASMAVAAWRGIGACEIFVVSNLLRKRNDQLACPLFFPVDRLENSGC